MMNIHNNKEYYAFDPVTGYVSASKAIIHHSSHTEASAKKAVTYREALPQLQISLTDACNLNCSYCSFRAREGVGKPVNMPIEQAKQAIRFFRNLGAKSLGARIDFGLAGEPLLRHKVHKDLLEAVTTQFGQSLMRLLRVGTHTTNATLFKEKLDPDHLAPPMDISIDGPKDVHDRHRKYKDGSGSFDDVAQVAKMALKKHPGLGSSTVLTADDTDFVKIFRFLSEEMGFLNIFMKPVNASREEANGLNERTLDAFKEGYTQLINYFISLPPERKLFELKKLSYDDYFMRFFYRLRDRSKEEYRCGAGKSGVYVDTDGKFYACAHFIGKKGWHIGSLADGFDTTATSEYYKLKVDDRAPCKNCEVRYLCGGGCYYQAALVNGRIDEPDAVKCELIRHQCRLAQKLLVHLAREAPEVLAGLPACVGVSPQLLLASPEDKYLPVSRLEKTDGQHSIALECMRGVEGRIARPETPFDVTLMNDGKGLSLSFNGNTQSVDEIEIRLFNTQLKPFLMENLKLPIDAYDPIRLILTKDGDEAWSCSLQQAQPMPYIQKVPYEARVLTVVSSENVALAAEPGRLDVCILKSFLSESALESLAGIQVLVRDPGGVRYLVRHEAFISIDMSVYGDLRPIGGEFSFWQISADIPNKFPAHELDSISRWSAMRDNIC